MPYYHGNLAVEKRQTAQIRETKKVIKHRYSISAKEKLLYLLVIVICSVIAGTVVFRYAQIYEINTRIQQIEQEIERLEKENRMLELEVRQLKEPKRLIEYGKAYGFSPSDENTVSEVSPEPVRSAPENMELAVKDSRTVN